MNCKHHAQHTMRYDTLFLLAVCFVACDNAYDAEKVAERYCDCMKSNNAAMDFTKASQVCNPLTATNRYIKLWLVDMDDRMLAEKLSDETRDSVGLFMDRFRDYTDANCCKETLACPDSAELKITDKKHAPDTAILLDEKVILLLEHTLNLPSVIEFSRVELIRKKYHNVYGRVYGFQLAKDSLKINQQGKNIIFLNSLDSVSTGKVPCFVFSELVVKGDTAEVRLSFPTTGFLAFGKMYYKQGRWHPTKKFLAGHT